MDNSIRNTPYDVYESILRVLNARRIERVLADQELIRDGWQIHFAVDPHDVGKFCFPFSPTSLLSHLKTSKVEEIARLQNGRYEAIYKMAARPILLKPYEEELDAIPNWATWSAYVPTEAELLDRYL